ncbi:MAG: urea transporter [Sulfurimonas sp.]
MNSFKTMVYNIIKPYSAILFLNNKYAGFFLLVITFLNPSIALSGIIAIIFTILFAELVGLKETSLAQGFYVYNSLLVGMGVGFIFSPSLVSIVLIAIASSLTFMLSFVLNKLFSVYKIPILSLPFSIVTMFIYLASLKYSGLLSSLVNNAVLYDISLPLILSGFFKSLGTIFFLPNNIAGILMIVLILYFSRIVVIMALVGYYFGVLIHSFLIGSFEQALYDPYAFNYILVAVALCGIFLLPTIKNFILALIGVSISVVLTDAIGILFNYYAIPVFTIPFNITVITFIFMLSVIYYKEFNVNIKSTPEESLSTYLSQIFRFGNNMAKISLPFLGEWSVYQAFDDEWTHQGKYKYAYDFVKKQDNFTYKNEGLYAQDYHCFGEPILSPISGYIVDMRDDLVDNIIGEVDRINNWGNYIIIKSDAGFFVEISHLMQYSIDVKLGSYIKLGSLIAKCGNSGYSPEPHVHIQVQDLGVLGGFTREFCFSEHYKNETLIFNTRLLKGDAVRAMITDRSVSARLLFILDDTFKYDVYKEAKQVSEATFIVKMNEYGEFYFQDEEKNRLYFYNDAKQFYFYNYEGKVSHLKHLFILAPRVPFISDKKTKFVDSLPLYLVKTRLQTIFTELLSIVKKDLSKMDVEYNFNGRSVSSKYGLVQLELLKKGFSLIKYDKIELKGMV